MIFRIFFIIGLIVIDIMAHIYIPHWAKTILKVSVQNAVIWGVVWYSLLRVATECTKYLLEIFSFPLLNQFIQNTQFSLAKKWHQQQSNVKSGEVLTYFRRIGFSFRMFFRYGVLTFIPSIYKLMIAFSVFYSIELIDHKTLGLLILGLIVPFSLLPSYMKTRKKGWQMTDQSGRVIEEFLHQKNWNALYQEKLEYYLLTQLKKESKAWLFNNIARNLFYLLKELCITGVTIFIFVKVVRNTSFDKKNFIFIQTHFMSVLKAYGSLFTSVIFISEAWSEIQKIYLFLKKPAFEAKIQYNKNIEIQDLTFAYPEEKPVFSHFYLTIHEGEKVLLKGDNGSGKSTLIKLLSGELKTQEDVIQGVIKRPQSFVVIEQEPMLLTESLYFHLTFALPFKPTETTLKNILKKVDLEHLSLDKIMSHEISTGEKIKVLIARALLEKPDVLVLDESLESLSLEQAEILLEEILQNIKTVIVISHRIPSNLFDKVVLLSKNH